MIVDCAVYAGGERRGGRLPIDEALESGRECPDGFVWIGLHEPTAEEFSSVADEFDLHPLAVEDAIHAHQRPKLEVYGNTLFVVLKTARYVDSEEVIKLGQVMLFLGEHFVVSVRHGEHTALGDVRRTLEKDPQRLRWGPTAVLHAVADRIVDEYTAVARQLDTDLDEIEEEVFSGGRGNRAERIYKLKREVQEFRRAVVPLGEPLDQLRRGKLPLVDPSAAEYFRDVHDHVLRESEHVEAQDALLDSALNANVAQVGMRQNDDMRKISAWVAIVALPTMIAGIYGMNFEHMPELDWKYGYAFALGLMVTSCLLLYRNFKRREWL